MAKKKEVIVESTNPLGDYLKAACEKSDKVFIPAGKSEWRLPTGIPSLDNLLGGGFAGGSVVQIYGPETVGKTSIAYLTAAQAIKMGKSVLLIPIENYQERYAQACGIDTESPLYHVMAADYAEYVFNIMIESVREFDVDLIILDSIAAVVPKGTMEKKQPTEDMDRGPAMASQARSVSDFIRKFQGATRRKQAIFIAINQLTTDIGHLHSSLKPTGGRQFQHFTDIKLSLWGSPDKDTGIIKTNVTVVKGKEFNTQEFGTTELYFRHADPRFTIVSDVIEQSILNKAIERSGAWFNIGDKKYQGMEALVKAVTDDNALFNTLLEKLICKGDDNATEET